LCFLENRQADNDQKRNQIADTNLFWDLGSGCDQFVTKLIFKVSKRQKSVVARDGIEPPTQAFSGLCSTN
tara:strand:- start:137 stop:346 length:210 start_codon:yes stop_codon:yes gene_type:complete